MAGVGMIPALVKLPPSLIMPAASSRSIHSPDSRMSRPARKRTRLVAWPEAASPPGRFAPYGASARVSAAPSRRIVGMSSGYWPALPRTPSVPNSRPITLLFNRDPHVRRLDFDDAHTGGRDDFHRQLERAGAKPLDVDG